jgi:hypothetical protein
MMQFRIIPTLIATIGTNISLVQAQTCSFGVNKVDGNCCDDVTDKECAYFVNIQKYYTQQNRCKITGFFNFETEVATYSSCEVVYDLDNSLELPQFPDELYDADTGCPRCNVHTSELTPEGFPQFVTFEQAAVDCVTTSVPVCDHKVVGQSPQRSCIQEYQRICPFR